MRRFLPFRALRSRNVPAARPEREARLSESPEPEALLEDFVCGEQPVIILAEDDLAELLADGLLDPEDE